MSSFVDMVESLPETLPYNPNKQYIIDHSGMVNKLTYQVLVAVFTVIATVAAITRLVIHIKYPRKPFVDDYLMVFATACLAVQTGIVYKYSDMVYLMSSLDQGLATHNFFTRSEVLALPSTIKWTNIFICFAWTVNYTIKLSFLAFFWTLIRNVSKRLTRYWWFVLVFVVLSWLFSTVENFIICGANTPDKCYPSPRFIVPLTITISMVDILSDLMIISIPIIILNKSQMRLSQKLRILGFLCLNVFMATFSLLRIAGIYRDTYGTVQVRVEWTILTLHMESSVAVLMGGATAFRTVFASRIRGRGHPDPERLRSNLYYHVGKFFNRGTPSGNPELPQSDNYRTLLTGIRTGGTLNGLKTSIRRHKQEPGHTAVSDNVSCDNSVHGYHVFKKSEGRGMEADLESNLDSKAKENVFSSPPERPMPTLQAHNMI
ncbi:hypothetical protein P154DRAFT_570949 [Amniculicola lignicola CBS 123094]|uniref:Rhodopsin domain-containing protein n=1 Tax=Amniculicola lignicola CBS 123094 TaxID=1392246 RepID=A0A6A5WZN7_9PLEO|nr:hypothetical protein P154DRAFT_570949 [Amniculicola lignicola CBS 123094]